MGMKTRAVRQGHHYILNGRKMWITNGNINGGSVVVRLSPQSSATSSSSTPEPSTESVSSSSPRYVFAFLVTTRACRGSRWDSQSSTSWECARREPRSWCSITWRCPRTVSSARRAKLFSAWYRCESRHIADAQSGDRARDAGCAERRRRQGRE